MDFELPPETAQLSDEIGRWNARRGDFRAGIQGNTAEWREFVDFGVIGLEVSDGNALDTAVGIMAGAYGGLPGPIVEAEMALRSGNKEARAALEKGKIVTSIKRCTGPRVLVPWGAIADLVIDLSNGEVVARGPLPSVRSAFPCSHGWLEVAHDSAGKEDGNPETMRWIVGAAAIAGLAQGAFDRTLAYAKERVQFGRPLAGFQSLQHRLVECLLAIEGTRLGVLDAAWRVSEQNPQEDVAAALAWLSASRCSRVVRKHCHQIFGATGFCYESGLTRLTWDMWWLELLIGDEGSSKFVQSRRRDIGVDPSACVLDGFALTGTDE
jgi:hypothetical protein